MTADKAQPTKKDIQAYINKSNMLMKLYKLYGDHKSLAQLEKNRDTLNNLLAMMGHGGLGKEMGKYTYIS